MRRLRKYVVGHDTDDYLIYGIDCDCRDWLDPLNKTQAKKKQVEFSKPIYYNNRKLKYPKVVIYELVPIKEKDK